MVKYFVLHIQLLIKTAIFPSYFERKTNNLLENLSHSQIKIFSFLIGIANKLILVWYVFAPRIFKTEWRVDKIMC